MMLVVGKSDQIPPKQLDPARYHAPQAGRQSCSGQLSLENSDWVQADDSGKGMARSPANHPEARTQGEDFLKATQ
jgi:hypothetical protein